MNKPNLPELENSLAETLRDASDALRKRDILDDVRYCRWSGQSEDGRKHESDLGHRPTPWEGSSDTRIRLADRIVNEHVRLVTESLFRAQMNVVGVGQDDIGKASLWNDLLSWLVHQKVTSELRAQSEILANAVFSDHPAVGVMGVYWKQETGLEATKIDLERVAQMVMEAGGTPEALENIIMILQDPETEDAALQLIETGFPGVEKKALKKALKDFRSTGEAILPTPTILENRPCFQAHRLFDDIFVPANTHDMQTVRCVFRRQWLTETQIREKEHTEGWSRKFINELLKHEGKSSYDTGYNNLPTGYGLESLNDQSTGPHEGQYEVWYSYRRESDGNGIPGIYCTSFSPFVKDAHGKHELLSYAHGKMPFVLFSRERLSQSIFDSRSINEIVQTYQYEMKVQRDCRTDATMISTLPPLQVHARRGGLNLLLAPGAQISVQRPDDLGWLNPPPMPNGSIEVESRSQADVEEYFGGSADPQKRILYQQYVVNRWLDGWKECLTQAFSLCQQYWSPQFIQRITNAGPEAVMVAQEDILGQYDLVLRFSATNLDPEFTEKKLKSISSLILPMDATNVIDRSALIKMSIEMLDPQMAQTLVMSDQAASMKEVDDEQNAWVKIGMGIEPALEESANFPLRLQTAQQILQTSQELQAKMQQQPLISQLAEARMKNLQFGLQQRQNAQIGRVGAAPVLPGEEAGAAPMPPAPAGPADPAPAANAGY
tara:strand:- start:9374 stop:11533 length:2160 start_codon:yes stop_codon:yes gene_type:complete